MIRARVLVSGDPLSLSRGATDTLKAIAAELEKHDLKDEVQVEYTHEMCGADFLPLVIVYPEGTMYGPVTAEDAPLLVEEHLLKGRVAEDLLAPDEIYETDMACLHRRESALGAQESVVLRRLGEIDAYSLDDYIALDGYFALGQALTEMTSEAVLNTVKESGLRGRGGAGFPTGLKWSFVVGQPGVKYIVCNADESEPGTFKDRLILEGDPHAVLEAMALAGYAVGANEGWIYIRGEYTLARQRLQHAIEQAEEMGLLGDNIMGTDFSFHIHIHAGAGAYICGEETALLESMEGKRGTPRIRPPYPTVEGFRSQPTVVNNVETLANVPPIILNGAEWFSSIGSEDCPGTKVYTLLGDVNITGLIETPMGTTLRDVIEVYGGGMRDGKGFKCAQTGGTSGSIIPPDLLDTPMDFDALADEGAALGSGALLICDEDTCVVDLAYVLLRFFKTESCGKCVPCRVGTSQMLESLDRLRKGYAKQGDLDRLEEAAEYVQSTSFCGLGQAAPVPIITGLRWFRDEFEAHLKGECPAEVCSLEALEVKAQAAGPLGTSE